MRRLRAARRCAASRRQVGANMRTERRVGGGGLKDDENEGGRGGGGGGRMRPVPHLPMVDR
eukprot:6125769-Pyramimonas_sp.AAC.1